MLCENHGLLLAAVMDMMLVKSRGRLLCLGVVGKAVFHNQPIIWIIINIDFPNLYFKSFLIKELY